MRNKILLIILLQPVFLWCIGQSRFDKDPFSFADSILKHGEYKVDLMEVDYPIDIKLLLAKMNDAIAKDSAWFLEYLNKNVQDTGGLKYHVRLGLTEAEFKKMKNGLSEEKKYVKVGEETLIITNTDSLIRFKGTGDIAEIGHLVVDKKNKIVKFNNTIIPYKNEIHADDWTVVKAWDGHQFRSEETNITDLARIKEIKASSYRLLIGKTQKTQRNYFKLEAKQIDSGEKPLDVEFAFFFD